MRARWIGAQRERERKRRFDSCCSEFRRAWQFSFACYFTCFVTQFFHDVLCNRRPKYFKCRACAAGALRVITVACGSAFRLVTDSADSWWPKWALTFIILYHIKSLLLSVVSRLDGATSRPWPCSICGCCGEFWLGFQIAISIKCGMTHAPRPERIGSAICVADVCRVPRGNIAVGEISKPRNVLLGKPGHPPGKKEASKKRIFEGRKSSSYFQGGRCLEGLLVAHATSKTP